MIYEYINIRFPHKPIYGNNPLCTMNINHMLLYTKIKTLQGFYVP